MEKKPTKDEAEVYVKSFLKRLREDPNDLSRLEKLLGAKYTDARAAADKIAGELEQLRSQLRQGETRVRTMELQVQSEIGKAEGFLTSIVELELDTIGMRRKKTEKKDNGRDAEPPVAMA